MIPTILESVQILLDGEVVSESKTARGLCVWVDLEKKF